MPTSTVYNIDCLEYLKTVSDKFFELAVVDPPYGISVNMQMGKKKGEIGRYEKKKWDSDIPSAEFFKELQRTSKNFKELQRTSKNQIVFGGNYFTEHLPPSMGWIFWDKEVPMGVSFSDGELAWTSFQIALKKAYIPYCGFIGIDPEGRVHPTQKPVKLYKWILSNYAKQGDKILDTHMGSQSSRIAAYDM